MNIDRPGTKAWHDRVLDQLKAKHGEHAGLKSINAKMDTDPADPLLFTARITKSVLDRDGEVLLPGGMDASEFDVSGAVFWNHNYDSPVAVSVGKLQGNANEVIAKARFIERVEGDNSTFLPDYARAFVTAMAKAGRSAGVSVGFVGLDYRNPTKKDREDFGESVTRVYTRWKLLEWSIAPVQANQDAYVTAMGKSLDPVVCKSLFGVEPEIVPALPAPDLSGVKALAELRRTVRATAKRRRDEQIKQRKAAKARQLVQMKLLPKIALAKARGELWVGQYGKETA